MRQPPAFKISFARRSSATSRLSRFSSSASSVVTPGPLASIDLSATNPRAHGLRSAYPEFAGHRTHRSPLRPILRSHLLDHPHRALPKLLGVLARSSHAPDPPNEGSLRTRREVSRSERPLMTGPRSRVHCQIGPRSAHRALGRGRARRPTPRTHSTLGESAAWHEGRPGSLLADTRASKRPTASAPLSLLKCRRPSQSSFRLSTEHVISGKRSTPWARRRCGQMCW